MSSVTMSYDAVKSSIRLLLTSAANGLTMAQLDADYQRYNHSFHVPFAEFGYHTLFDFLRDIPDVALIEMNSNPPIIHGIKAISRKKKQKLRQKWALRQTKDRPTDGIDSSSRSATVGKPIKRLALHPLSVTSANMNNDRRRPLSSSSGYLIRKMSNLCVDVDNDSRHPSPVFCDNLHQNEIITIPVNANNTCRIVRSSNGKIFIPCFELARVLQIDEDLLDRETMFSRVRVYQTDDLFNNLTQANICCQHMNDARRSYFFLFLIASIIPVLKMAPNYQYIEFLSTVEQFFV